MKSCEQTKNQSVLQHGESVKEHLFDIINHLRHDIPLKYEWQLPEWLYENKQIILSSLPDDETLKLYTTYHDCGKPFCAQIDELGKKHFPDHANISYQIFNSVFDNKVAAHLILHDMDIHLLKSSGVEEFSKLPYCLTLLLTGLAEIHSNCKMFGGFESTSFKIKFKSITQRGKQIFKFIRSEKLNDSFKKDEIEINFKNIRDKIIELPFIDCATEIIEDKLKIILRFEGERLLFLTISNNEYLVTYFIDKNLIYANTIELNDFIKKFNQYLKNKN